VTHPPVSQQQYLSFTTAARDRQTPDAFVDTIVIGRPLMVRSRVLMMISLFLLSPILGTGTEGKKDQESSASAASRFDIKMLPGYRLQILPGLDTIGARIFRPGGLSIDFASGEHLQKKADELPSSKVYWKTKQTINGRLLTCAYTRSGYLVATILKLG